MYEAYWSNENLKGKEVVKFVGHILHFSLDSLPTIKKNKKWRLFGQKTFIATVSDLMTEPLSSI